MKPGGRTGITSPTTGSNLKNGTTGTRRAGDTSSTTAGKGKGGERGKDIPGVEQLGGCAPSPTRDVVKLTSRGGSTRGGTAKQTVVAAELVREATGGNRVVDPAGLQADCRERDDEDEAYIDSFVGAATCFEVAGMDAGVGVGQTTMPTSGTTAGWLASLRSATANERIADRERTCPEVATELVIRVARAPDAVNPGCYLPGASVKILQYGHRPLIPKIKQASVLFLLVPSSAGSEETGLRKYYSRPSTGGPFIFSADLGVPLSVSLEMRGGILEREITYERQMDAYSRLESTPLAAQVASPAAGSAEGRMGYGSAASQLRADLNLWQQEAADQFLQYPLKKQTYYCSNVEGPPGSGKTTLYKAAMTMLWEEVKAGRRVWDRALMCSANNAAIEDLAQKMDAERVPVLKYTGEVRLKNTATASRSPSEQTVLLDVLGRTNGLCLFKRRNDAEAAYVTLQKQIQDKTNKALKDETSLEIQRKQLALLSNQCNWVLCYFAILCLSTTSSSVRVPMAVSRIAVDEKTQVPEAESVVATSALLRVGDRGGVITHTGDAQQLRNYALTSGYQQQYSDRLASTITPVTLWTVYRSEDAIVDKFRARYGDELRNAGPKAHHVKYKYPALTVVVAADATVPEKHVSHTEVQMVRFLLDHLLQRSQQPEKAHDVIILAPYKKQAELLRKEVGGDVVVGTVDAFQGREAAIVISSEAAVYQTDHHSDERNTTQHSRAQRLHIAVVGASFFKHLQTKPAPGLILQALTAAQVCTDVQLKENPEKYLGYTLTTDVVQSTPAVARPKKGIDGDGKVKSTLLYRQVVAYMQGKRPLHARAGFYTLCTAAPVFMFERTTAAIHIPTGAAYVGAFRFLNGRLLVQMHLANKEFGSIYFRDNPTRGSVTKEVEDGRDSVYVCCAPDLVPPVLRETPAHDRRFVFADFPKQQAIEGDATIGQAVTTVGELLLTKVREIAANNPAHIAKDGVHTLRLVVGCSAAQDRSPAVATVLISALTGADHAFVRHLWYTAMCTRHSYPGDELIAYERLVNSHLWKQLCRELVGAASIAPLRQPDEDAEHPTPSDKLVKIDALWEPLGNNGAAVELLNSCAVETGSVVASGSVTTLSDFDSPEPAVAAGGGGNIEVTSTSNEGPPATTDDRFAIGETWPFRYMITAPALMGLVPDIERYPTCIKTRNSTAKRAKLLVDTGLLLLEVAETSNGHIVLAPPVRQRLLEAYTRFAEVLDPIRALVNVYVHTLLLTSGILGADPRQYASYTTGPSGKRIQHLLLRDPGNLPLILAVYGISRQGGPLREGRTAGNTIGNHGEAMLGVARLIAQHRTFGEEQWYPTLSYTINCKQLDVEGAVGDQLSAIGGMSDIGLKHYSHAKRHNDTRHAQTTTFHVTAKAASPADESFECFLTTALSLDALARVTYTLMHAVESIAQVVFRYPAGPTATMKEDPEPPVLSTATETYVQEVEDHLRTLYMELPRTFALPLATHNCITNDVDPDLALKFRQLGEYLVQQTKAGEKFLLLPARSAAAACGVQGEALDCFPVYPVTGEQPGVAPTDGVPVGVAGEAAVTEAEVQEVHEGADADELGEEGVEEQDGTCMRFVGSDQELLQLRKTDPGVDQVYRDAEAGGPESEIQAYVSDSTRFVYELTTDQLPLEEENEDSENAPRRILRTTQEGEHAGVVGGRTLTVHKIRSMVDPAEISAVYDKLSNDLAIGHQLHIRCSAVELQVLIDTYAQMFKRAPQLAGRLSQKLVGKPVRLHVTPEHLANIRAGSGTADREVVAEGLARGVSHSDWKKKFEDSEHESGIQSAAASLAMQRVPAFNPPAVVEPTGLIVQLPAYCSAEELSNGPSGLEIRRGMPIDSRTAAMNRARLSEGDANYLFEQARTQRARPLTVAQHQRVRPDEDSCDLEPPDQLLELGEEGQIERSEPLAYDATSMVRGAQHLGLLDWIAEWVEEHDSDALTPPHRINLLATDAITESEADARLAAQADAQTTDQLQLSSDIDRWAYIAHTAQQWCTMYRAAEPNRADTTLTPSEELAFAELEELGHLDEIRQAVHNTFGFGEQRAHGDAFVGVLADTPDLEQGDLDTGVQSALNQKQKKVRQAQPCASDERLTYGGILRKHMSAYCLKAKLLHKFFQGTDYNITLADVVKAIKLCPECFGEADLKMMPVHSTLSRVADPGHVEVDVMQFDFARTSWTQGLRSGGNRGRNDEDDTRGTDIRCIITRCHDFSVRFTADISFINHVTEFIQQQDWKAEHNPDLKVRSLAVSDAETAGLAELEGTEITVIPVARGAKGWGFPVCNAFHWHLRQELRRTAGKKLSPQERLNIACANILDAGTHGVDIRTCMPELGDIALARIEKRERLQEFRKLLGTIEYKNTIKKRIWCTASTLLNFCGDRNPLQRIIWRDVYAHKQTHYRGTLLNQLGTVTFVLAGSKTYRVGMNAVWREKVLTPIADGGMIGDLYESRVAEALERLVQASCFTCHIVERQAGDGLHDEAHLSRPSAKQVAQLWDRTKPAYASAQVTPSTFARQRGETGPGQHGIVQLRYEGSTNFPQLAHVAVHLETEKFIFNQEGRNPYSGFWVHTVVDKHTYAGVIWTGYAQDGVLRTVIWKATPSSPNRIEECGDGSAQLVRVDILTELQALTRQRAVAQRLGQAENGSGHIEVLTDIPVTRDTQPEALRPPRAITRGGHRDTLPHVLADALWWLTSYGLSCNRVALAQVCELRWYVGDRATVQIHLTGAGCVILTQEAMSSVSKLDSMSEAQRVEFAVLLFASTSTVIIPADVEAPDGGALKMKTDLVGALRILHGILVGLASRTIRLIEPLSAEVEAAVSHIVRLNEHTGPVWGGREVATPVPTIPASSVARASGADATNGNAEMGEVRTNELGGQLRKGEVYTILHIKADRSLIGIVPSGMSRSDYSQLRQDEQTQYSFVGDTGNTGAPQSDYSQRAVTINHGPNGNGIVISELTHVDTNICSTAGGVIFQENGYKPITLTREGKVIEHTICAADGGQHTDLCPQIYDVVLAFRDLYEPTLIGYASARFYHWRQYSGCSEFNLGCGFSLAHQMARPKPGNPFLRWTVKDDKGHVVEIRSSTVHDLGLQTARFAEALCRRLKCEGFVEETGSTSGKPELLSPLLQPLLPLIDKQQPIRPRLCAVGQSLECACQLPLEPGSTIILSIPKLRRHMWQIHARGKMPVIAVVPADRWVWFHARNMSAKEQTISELVVDWYGFSEEVIGDQGTVESCVRQIEEFLDPEQEEEDRVAAQQLMGGGPHPLIPLAPKKARARLSKAAKKNQAVSTMLERTMKHDVFSELPGPAEVRGDLEDGVSIDIQKEADGSVQEVHDLDARVVETTAQRTAVRIVQTGSTWYEHTQTVFQDLEKDTFARSRLTDDRIEECVAADVPTHRTRKLRWLTGVRAAGGPDIAVVEKLANYKQVEIDQLAQSAVGMQQEKAIDDAEQAKWEAGQSCCNENSEEFRNRCAEQMLKYMDRRFVTDIQVQWQARYEQQAGGANRVTLAFVIYAILAFVATMADIYVAHHHIEGQSIPFCTNGEVSLKNFDLSQAPKKHVKVLPLKGIMLRKVLMLLRRELLTGLMAFPSAALGIILFLSNVFRAFRKLLSVGRLVTDYRPVNPMCRLTALPPITQAVAFEHLDSDDFRFYAELDVAKAFNSLWYSQGVIAWMGVQTAHIMLLALRGQLGLKTMPALWGQKTAALSLGRIHPEAEAELDSRWFTLAWHTWTKALSQEKRTTDAIANNLVLVNLPDHIAREFADRIIAERGEKITAEEVLAERGEKITAEEVLAETSQRLCQRIEVEQLADTLATRTGSWLHGAASTLETPADLRAAGLAEDSHTGIIHASTTSDRRGSDAILIAIVNDRLVPGGSGPILDDLATCTITADSQAETAFPDLDDLYPDPLDDNDNELTGMHLLRGSPPTTATLDEAHGEAMPEIRQAYGYEETPWHALIHRFTAAYIAKNYAAEGLKFFTQAQTDDVAFAACTASGLLLRYVVTMNTFRSLNIKSSLRKLKLGGAGCDSLSHTFHMGQRRISECKINNILNWDLNLENPAQLASLLGIMVYISASWGPHYHKIVAVLNPYLRVPRNKFKQLLHDNPAAIKALGLIRNACSNKPMRGIPWEALAAGTRILVVFIDANLFGCATVVCSLPVTETREFTRANIYSRLDTFWIHEVDSSVYPTDLRWCGALEQETYGLRRYKRRTDVRFRGCPRVVITDHKNLQDMIRTLHSSSSAALTGWLTELLLWTYDPFLRLLVGPSDTQLADLPSRMLKSIRVAKECYEAALSDDVSGLLRALFPVLKRVEVTPVNGTGYQPMSQRQLAADLVQIEAQRRQCGTSKDESSFADLV